MRVNGEFTLDDAREYVEIRDRIGAEQSYLLLLVDVQKATSMQSAVRRYIAERPPPCDPQNGAIAIVGAGAVLRALLQLLFSAITLLGKRPVFPGFVTSEAAAHSYLDEQRKRILAQLARN